MAIIIDVEGATRGQIHVRIDPLTEMGSLLHAVAYGDHHPRASRLRRRIQESSDDELLSQTKKFQPFFGAIRARFLMPLEVSHAHIDVLDQIEALSGISLNEFVEMAAVAMSEQRPNAYDFSDVLTSRASQDYFLHTIEHISMSRVELAADLLKAPEKVRQQFQAFLRRVAEEWFSDEWRSGLQLLKADAALREQEIGRLGPAALAGVLPTAVAKTDPARIVYDKVNKAFIRLGSKPVILVPSLHASPHLIVKFDRGYPVVVLYEAGARPQESLSTVTARLRALQHPTRIELCRMILRTPRTTVDLALKLEMSQPQVSRHLRALREAGLVTLERQGRLVYYSTNVHVMRSLGSHLLAALYR